MLAASTRSQAGGHYEGPTYTHKITVTNGTESHSLVQDEEDPNAEALFGSGGEGNGGIGYSANLGWDIKYEVTAKFKWIRDAATPDAPPPDKEYFLETGYAEANDHFYGSSGEEPDADNGLGDAAQVVPDPEVPFAAYECWSLGSHLQEKSGEEIEFTHTLSSTLKGDYAVGSCSVFYSVAITSPPKSVIINGPGGTSSYDDSQWTGNGDTLFNNYEPDQYNISAGHDYGQISWSPSLLGSPWPAFADWQAGWFTREWHWFSDGNSASGGDYGSPQFLTDRPHVDWPFDSDGRYIPKNFLEECKNAPASQTKHAFVHLIDTDQLGTHPEWNFDKTANYYVTFHTENELVEEAPTQDIPTSENSWKLLVLSGGTNVQAGGPFTNWQPTVYYEVNQDSSISFNGAAWLLESGASFSTGTSQGYNLSINPQPIPAGSHGAVYWRPSIVRHPFTYNKYTLGGIIYESYNSDGSGVPFHDHVDLSRGYPDAPNDIDAKIVVVDSDEAFDPVINYD